MNENQSENNIDEIFNNTNPSTNKDDDFTLREGLRESAFRKYEPFILAAIENGTYTVDTSTAFPRKMLSKTFMTQFTDALKGQRENSYLSNIPTSFDLHFIKCRQVEKYKVRIINCVDDRIVAEKAKNLTVSNWDVLLLELTNLNSRYASGDYPSKYTKISVSSMEEYVKVRDYVDTNFAHLTIGNACEEFPGLVNVL